MANGLEELNGAYGMVTSNENGLQKKIKKAKIISLS